MAMGFGPGIMAPELLPKAMWGTVMPRGLVEENGLIPRLTSPTQGAPAI